MARYRTLLALLIGFVTSATVGVVGAATALAQVPPPDPSVPPRAPGTSVGGATTSITHPGSPIWTFVVVAALTMLVTATVTYIAAGRRRQLSEQVAAPTPCT